MILIPQYRTARRASAAGAWAPSMLSGIYAYYDATDISTLWKDTAGTDPVTTAGDLVARIDDLSGNGHHLLQATSGSRGAYASGGGITMDGTADVYLESTAASNTALPVYLACAYTRGTSSTALGLFRFGGATTEHASLAQTASDPTGRLLTYIRDTTVGQILVNTANNSWPVSTKKVIDGLSINGTTDAQVNNGTLGTGANTWSGADTIAAPKAGVCGLSGGAASAGTFWAGIIALANPGSDRANAKQWLADIAGVTL